MPLIGTAGHVDHGKSTLIQALTGRDPDRWALEKERGLTIDLGFAWMTLPGGATVSFVDVPGHEKYLKNMLAGIEAIDLALFVVAADEGWMPQSEEHLAVLDLLDVEHGVVALTKIDAVDDDLGRLAATEVADRLSGTTLSDAPIVAVSARDRIGLDRLTAELEKHLPASVPDKSRPRLWVDRVFAAHGAGTIVTGTLLDGGLTVGEEVEILPQGISARVRGIQSHEQRTESVGPGRRIALNLSGVDHHQISRGDMVGRPGQWLMTDRVTVGITSARYVESLPAKGDYQIHIGSAAHRVRIIGLSEGVALLKLARPLPLVAGDRFILRDTGRKLVTAGGRVLDPSPPPRVSRALTLSRTIDPSATPDEIADSLLAARGAAPALELEIHSGGGTARRSRQMAGMVVTADRLAELTNDATAIVRRAYEEHPLRNGLPLATLAETLGLDVEAAATVVTESGELTRIGPDVGLTGREARLSSDQESSWVEAERRLASSLAVPGESDLGLDPDVIGLKLRNGELVRIAPGLVYLAGQIDQLKGAISEMGEGFTVSQFRDATGLSRKYAVPILEWSDKEGLTVRRGDTRSVR
jgi:selenocysteine-specific elongation factor